MNGSQFAGFFAEALLRHAPYHPQPDLLELLIKTAGRMYSFEYLPPQKPAVSDPLAQARYRDALARFQRIDTFDARVEWITTLIESFMFFLAHLPQYRAGPYKFTIQPTREMIDHLTVPFRLNNNPEFFAQVKRTLDHNYQKKNATPAELLANTPLTPLLSITTSIGIPPELEFAHTWVVAGCLHADTPIYDPVANTTFTVHERCQFNTHFHVFSLQGDRVVIGRAHPPTRYTTEKMWRLTNGTHAITVTPQHRVFDGSSFVSLATLSRRQASASFRLPTISDIYPSVLPPDAPRSSKTAADYLTDYHFSPHSDGLPLHAAVSTAPVSSPLPTDAPAHCRIHSDADASASTPSRTRSYQNASHPSMTGSAPRSNKIPFPEYQYLASATGLAPCHPQNQAAALFPQATYPSHTNPVPNQSALQSIASFQYTTWTLEPATDAVYYDFHVEKYHNYYACGLFHHNSGHGKTTLLTSMLYPHIAEVVRGETSIVLMDSQNVLIPLLERLKVWEGSERLIVVDPDDPIAFSLFDAPASQLNSTLEMVDFVFGKLSESEMTYRQQNMFNYLAEFLVTAVPNATIHDFRNMLDVKRAAEYDQHIPKASTEVRDYLTTDFVKEKFTIDARHQVLTKMRGMLRNEAFARMFGAPKTKLNLFKELERGVCILIKPDKYKLGDDGTRLFGRFWIAQMQYVARQRQATQRKTPTYFYIDEAQDYLKGGDPKIEGILEQARKENIGLTLLHHGGHQLRSDDLLQLLGANTATKMCGSLGSADLSRFAGYLGCDPNFIRAQEPRQSFAAHIRGMTKSAISLRPPYIDLKKEPRMSEDAWRQMRKRNSEKYGAAPQSSASSTASSTASTNSSGATTTSPTNLPRNSPNIPPIVPPPKIPSKW